MTPPKDGRERGGFNKIEDIVFQFGNSQVSVIGIPAVFKKKSELLFSECPIWKAEVGDPPHHRKACTVAWQTLHASIVPMGRLVG